MKSTTTTVSAGAIRSSTKRLAFAAALLFPASAIAQSPFGPSEAFLIRSGPTSTDVVDDFDGDGILDVIKNAPGTAGVLLFRGLGAGEFGFTSLVLPTSAIGNVSQKSTGDLDGDGDTDLLAISIVQPFIERLVNDGTGSFSVGALGIPGGPWRDARFADVNGDGAQDLLLMMSASGTHTLFWVDGQSGSFNTLPQFLITQSGPSLETLDVDGDGNLDLTSFASNGGLRVSFGLGNAAFAPFAPLPGSASIAVNPLTLRDVDGDGVVEIFAARPNGLKYFRATGPRLWAPSILLAPSLDNINTTKVLDLDGDGDLDVLHLTSNSSTGDLGGTANALTFLQTLPGVFAPGAPTSSTVINFASVKDINDDGLQDLILAGVEGLQWQLGGAGAGTDYFGPTQSTNKPLYSVSSHAVADLDRDGDLDIVLASGEQRKLGWIEKLGSGSFAESVVLAESSEIPVELRVIDLESDGDDDFVVLRRTGVNFIWDVAVFTNDGLGAFALTGTPLSFMADRVERFEVLDFDADGNVDVFMYLRPTFATRAAQLFLGDGLGQFNQVADPIAGGPSLLDARAGDFDGDGLPEVAALTTGSLSPQSILIARNQGNGTFTAAPPHPVPTFAAWLDLVDLNQDGLLDAVTSYLGRFMLHPGTGSGSLLPGAVTNLSVQSQPGFADLDGDGDLDAYSTLSPFVGEALWSEQVANGTFLNPSDLYADGASFGEISRFADLDGDGDLDAVVRELGRPMGSQLRVYDNRSLIDIGQPLCNTQLPNSSGTQGLLAAYGSELVQTNNVKLNASGLPSNQFGLLLGSRTFGLPISIPGSMGLLCLSGDIGRYQGPGQIQSSGPGGSISIDLDLLVLSTPNGPVAGLAGESWSFQLWHRDSVQGSTTSNLTTGVSITLQ